MKNMQTSEQIALKKVKLKRAIGHEEKTNRWGYVFVAPFVMAFLIFNFWPTINTILISATDLKGIRNDYIFGDANCPSCDGEGMSVEIDENGELVLDAFGNIVDVECEDCHGGGKVTPVLYNYGRLVKDKFFWGALGNTFIIWMLNFVPQLGMALILAIWLSDAQLNLTGKGLFRAVIYMPNLLTAASVALLFRSLFGEGGHVNAPANQFLRALGIYYNNEALGITHDAFNFFRSVPFTRGLVAFIQWWMWYGHTLILLMAGITSIPVSLYESATVDGANSRQTAWYITLPLLRPMMLFILVTSAIGGMQMFDIPFLLTNRLGGPDFKIRTTVLYQYNVAFMGAFDRAYGAAISIGIFLVTIALALLIFFFLQDRSDLQKRRGGIK
ncbi:MAG: sugar ABC transporter permease [Treponema sp.]|nr:sugar ABC transporter permease [Treponema sp.]MCL2236854.1 sugar ABC transporter permease [Treponema sp.]